MSIDKSTEYHIIKTLTQTSVYVLIDQYFKDQLMNIPLLDKKLIQGKKMENEFMEEYMLIFSGNMISNFLVAPIVMNLVDKVIKIELMDEFTEAFIDTITNSLILMIAKYSLNVYKILLLFGAALTSTFFTDTLHQIFQSHNLKKNSYKKHLLKD